MLKAFALQRLNISVSQGMGNVKPASNSRGNINLKNAEHTELLCVCVCACVCVQ